jgi:hypothetical protein
MLVFGDRKRIECPRRLLDELRCAAARVDADATWIVRHARLVELFVRAADLAQGVLDAAFAQEREDRLGVPSEVVDAVLRRVARALSRSWVTGETPPPITTMRAIARLAELPLPETIETKDVEGYAHYALYPESYAMAAQTLLGASPTVIGLRSIGLGLGAIVAANTKAPLSLSLRPVGHPFRRELALASELRQALRARRDGLFAIVDEGPGLSGSSFAAVADALEGLGVAQRNIHFFPSHRNPPGSAATPEIAERWQAAPKHVVAFEDMALDTHEPRHRLSSWVEDLTGPALAPLQDIGGGAWRDLRPDRASLPASPQKERRKFLLRSERGVFLLRFAGLGAKGQDTLHRARRLAQGGFTPELLGLRHGFLVERWEEDAAALDPAADRSALIAHLARYLAFRSRHLPAAEDSGATLRQLDEMRQQNIREVCAIDPADGIAMPAMPASAVVRRVETDNRMHAWEWLRRPDGRIVKTDAIDHCNAHDLIGCQDIAWDAVGASIEFSLSDNESSELSARLRAAGCPVDPQLLAFYETCYLAFQAASFSLDAQAPLSCRDRQALNARACHYGSLLEKRWIHRLSAGTIFVPAR